MSDIVPASDIAQARLKRFELEGYPAWKSTLLEHPDGIYIHLPELDYLNDMALSYSAFKLLNANPPDWWWQTNYNVLEDKVRKSTPALRFGSALHCALLESMEELEKRFFTPPDPKDKRWADYARTIPQIKLKIKELDEKPISTTAKGDAAVKKDWVEQLLDLDPCAKLFDNLVTEWKGAGRTELTEEQFTKLRLMVQLAHVHPQLKQAFGGVGLSEVSVFWTEDEDTDCPIRMRARFDRLKPRSTIDLKSFSNWQDRDFRSALLREAALRGYHIQAAHYDVAREKAIEFLRQGKIYFCEEVLLTAKEIADVNAEREDPADHLEVGAKRTVFRSPTEEEMETVKAVFGSEEWQWLWVFYKTDGAPTAQPVRLDRTEQLENGEEVPTMPMRVGHEKRNTALAVYRQYYEQFGARPGEMWLRMDPTWTPQSAEWPFFMDPSVS